MHVAVRPLELEKGATWRVKDLWYAVFLGGGATAEGATFARVAWFYNNAHILELLPQRKFARLRKRYVLPVFVAAKNLQATLLKG